MTIQTLSPDFETMLQHLTWLVAPVVSTHSDLRIEIAWGHPDRGPNYAKTFPICDVAAAAGLAEQTNKKGNNVYVGVTLKSADAPKERRTASEHAVMATCVPIDIDKNFDDARRKLKVFAKPQLAVLTGTTPEVRAQLWFSISPTENMALWNELNRRMVAFSGGDQNALGSSRLMRLAGSVSHPSRMKSTRGYVAELTKMHQPGNAVTYDAPSLLQLFSAVATETATTTRTGAVKAAKAAANATTNTPRADRLPVNRINIGLVCSMLDALPYEYAEEYARWLRVKFAIRDFDDGEIGLRLWKKFSERCPEKAAETDFEAEWARLDREYDGDKITIGSLWYWAQQQGWQPPCRWDRSSAAHEARGTK